MAWSSSPTTVRLPRGPTSACEEPQLGRVGVLELVDQDVAVALARAPGGPPGGPPGAARPAPTWSPKSIQPAATAGAGRPPYARARATWRSAALERSPLAPRRRAAPGCRGGFEEPQGVGLVPLRRHPRLLGPAERLREAHGGAARIAEAAVAVQPEVEQSLPDEAGGRGPRQEARLGWQAELEGVVAHEPIAEGVERLGRHVGVAVRAPARPPAPGARPPPSP